MTIDINIENSAFLFIDVQEKLVSMLKEKIGINCAKKSEILAKTAKELFLEIF